MLIRTWRFFTVVLVALNTGIAFCHFLEIPLRLSYKPALWAQVAYLEKTYWLFGPMVGALLEACIAAFTIVLALLVRKRRPAFALTLTTVVCMVFAHVVWWALIYPVNSQIVSWTADSLPKDFATLRAQWEYSQGIRGILQIIGLSMLVLSILVETPRRKRLILRRAVPHQNLN